MQMLGKKGGKKPLHLSIEKWNSHGKEVSERKQAFSSKWQISLLNKTNWQDVVFMPSTGGPFPGTICVSTNRFPQYILKNLVIYCFINLTTAADSSFYRKVGIWTTASSCGGSSVLLPSAVGIAASQASLPSQWGCQTHNRYLRHRMAGHAPTHSLHKINNQGNKKVATKTNTNAFLSYSTALF